MTDRLLKQGDCLEVMRGFKSNSIDAIVTDPPYGLNDGKKGLSDIFLPTLFDVFLPKFNKGISKFINNLELPLPFNRIPFLNAVNRAVWIEP